MGAEAADTASSRGGATDSGSVAGGGEQPGDGITPEYGDTPGKDPGVGGDPGIRTVADPKVRGRREAYDVVIVGGGIVGLSLAREVLLRRPHASVLVVEKEPHVAEHASGRNSGVLHAGFYYAADSLKARTTKRGNLLLREFIAEAGLPLRACGKVVVTTGEAQLPALHVLAERAAANGVDVELISARELTRLEPLARTVGQALWSPTTAVADPRAVTQALADRVVALGAEVALGTTVVAAGPGWVRLAPTPTGRRSATGKRSPKGRKSSTGQESAAGDGSSTAGHGSSSGYSTSAEPGSPTGHGTSTAHGAFTAHGTSTAQQSSSGRDSLSEQGFSSGYSTSAEPGSPTGHGASTTSHGSSTADHGISTTCHGSSSAHTSASGGATWTVSAGHLINAAGLYADRVANWFGFAEDYRMLPFKGLYWYGSWPAGRLTRHVYPVPDPANPFLGVHLTVTVDGRAKIGPTAIPALWREDYGGVHGFDAREFAQISAQYPAFLTSPHHKAATLIRSEVPKYVRQVLVRQASALVPSVRPADFRTRGRVGVRAQMFHVPSRRLEMDFVVRGDEASTHVLNAVSPAWTSALAMAEHVVTGMESRGW